MNVGNKLSENILKQEECLNKLQNDLKTMMDIKNPYYYEGYKIGYIEGVIEGLKQAKKIIEENA